MSTDRENTKYEPKSTSSKTSYALIGVGLAVVVAVVGGILWQMFKPLPPIDDSVLAENASFIVGERTAPETIDVFEDFRCPHCKAFEANSGAKIQAKVTEGKLRVRYHVLNILDGESKSGDFSSRGAGAILCVARNDNRDVFWKLHSQLFAKAESDPSNNDIAGLAAAAGATPATQQCISGGALVGEAREMADASAGQLRNSTREGVVTPRVLSAGTIVENLDDKAAWLDDLIANPPKS